MATPIDYVRAAVQRKPGLAAGGAIPRIECKIPEARPASWRVTILRYLTRDSDGLVLPLTYPFLAAFPTFVKLMADPRFPFPLMGIVQVAVRLTRHRPILAEESLAITCWIEGCRTTERGVEFDLEATARVGEELVWSCASTMLKRVPHGAAAMKKAPKPVFFDGAGSTAEVWDVSAGIARKYAIVSGDVNPIHLSWATARAFGFKKTVLHGMWTVARIAAAHPELRQRQMVELRCDFKLPVLLPAKIRYRTWRQDDGSMALRVLDETGGKPHVVGTLSVGDETKTDGNRRSGRG